MGSVYTRPETDLMVYVQTGDRRRAGTDANVHIIIYDEEGHASRPIDLDNYFRDDFERGRLDKFRIPSRKVRRLNKMAEIIRVEFWKDSRWLGGDWYLDMITVKNNVKKSSFLFPVFRWIKSDYHYHIKHLSTSIPQFDEFTDQREMDLNEKRAEYEYALRFPDGIIKVKELPSDETFTFTYKWDFPYLKSTLVGASLVRRAMAMGKWENLNALKNMYNESTFSKPKCVNDWSDDIHFGLQRVAGFNHSVITLATSIPYKFPVTDVLLETLLEGLTLDEALEQKRLFLCDFQVLEDCPVKENYVLCHPIGLFFVDSKGHLRPVAIQLFQEPGPDNPIFTPKDPPFLWTLVKMWYNNADSAHHFAITRFARTQCLMEGFVVSMRRNLSQCHPIYKLLTPHFLYLIAINAKTLTFITTKGEWLDRNLNVGCAGFTALLIKGYKAWRLDTHGLLPSDLLHRGLDEPDVLPCYHFRDDALLLYDAIRTYVTSYVSLYYEDDGQVEQDWEIQSWVQELVADQDNGGVGIRGIPGDGELSTRSQLIDIATCIIYTCSVSHAATNFPQYEGYGFPPNYPCHMLGKPPASKTTVVTVRDLLDCLADKPNTLETMVFCKLFSTKGTNRLGHFEVDYIFDPKAKQVVKDFQKNLKEVSQEIRSRNQKRTFPYPYLDPELVPNNISI